MIRIVSISLFAFFAGASIGGAQTSEAVATSTRLRRVDNYTLRSQRHLVHDISPIAENGLVRVVVEIPAGTNAKWEVDKTDGHLKWEFQDGKPRVVSFLPYPGNYGMVPRTRLPKELGGDDDPLDVLILGPAVPRGSVVNAKLIGVLRMLDRGERDDKLLAVLPGSPLADANDIGDLKQRYPGALRAIEIWFASYKGPGKIEVEAAQAAGAAKSVLETAMKHYQRESSTKAVPAGN